MAWTTPTALFFAAIALMIAGMAVWERLVPGGAPRRGLLGIETRRGDRLFISLLGSAAVLAAQGQAPQQPRSFFVAANPSGTGNLGGLEGADRICQTGGFSASAQSLHDVNVAPRASV